MRITRTSRITGITRTQNLSITEEQYEDFRNGKLVQEAMPHLSPADREFIISGVTQDEWDKFIAGAEDDDA
jgi:hypothetical protein